MSRAAAECAVGSRPQGIPRTSEAYLEFEAPEQRIEATLGVTMSAFESEGPPWARRLRGALTALCAALAANPAMARLYFVEVLEAGPVTAARRRATMRGLLPLFEAVPAGALTELPFGESLRMAASATSARSSTKRSPPE